MPIRNNRTIVSRFAAAVVIALLGTAVIVTPAQAIARFNRIDMGVGADPRGVGVSPDGSLIIVALEGSNAVRVIDGFTNEQFLDIPVGLAPINVEVSPDGAVAYVVSSAGDAINVIDMATLAVVGPPISVGDFPQDVVFSPDGTTAYVSGYGTGTIAVIDVASATVMDTWVGFSEPQGITVSPDGSTVWFVGGSAVWSVDTTTFIVNGPIVMGDVDFPSEQPRFIDISPDGSTLIVGGDNTTKVYTIDTATAAVVDSTDIGDFAYSVAFNADGTRVFASRATLGGVAVMDAVTGALLETVSTDGNQAWGLAMSPTGNFGYASNHDDDSVTVFGDPVRRLTGTNRYGTAIKISQAAFPGGADIVYVATGTDYPDALAAGPAAAWNGAPVILTDNTVLAPEVKAEIERLNPTTIKIVGGTNRVSAGIQAELATIATVQRITGSNRYETSRLIALDAFDTAANGGGAVGVFISTGRNFPDALAAGAAGGTIGAPVILVDGTLPSVDQATLDLLADLGTTDIVVVGGTNMVSAGIEAQLGAFRLTGTNRYETALAINEAVYFGSSATTAILATGVIFPDALAASAWAGRIGAPLYLAPTSCVPQGVLDHMALLGVDQVVLVGGADRLTQSVFDLTAC